MKNLKEIPVDSSKVSKDLIVQFDFSNLTKFEE